MGASLREAGKAVQQLHDVKERRRTGDGDGEFRGIMVDGLLHQATDRARVKAAALEEGMRPIEEHKMVRKLLVGHGYTFDGVVPALKQHLRKRVGEAYDVAP